MSLLVSIILPTYNAAAYLDRSLQSIFSQAFSAYEVLVIDGGSTDGTLAILNRYASRIARLVSEPDQGLYDAMNKGAALASGQWLYFMGADDILENCLHQVAPYLKHPRTVYYGDVYLPHKNKTYAGRFRWHTLVSKNLNHQSIFYPRAVFTRYRFDLRYPVYADYALNLQVWGERKFKFRYIPMTIAQHSAGGVSHTQTDLAFEQDKARLISQYFGTAIAVRKFISNVKSTSVLRRPIASIKKWYPFKK